MPPSSRETGRVPGFLHFTADDYRAAAMALRIAAVQAEKDAENQRGSSTAERFIDLARRRRELAEKYELAARVL